VTVVEKSLGPRTEGSALGLWTNAWRSLDALGIAGELRSQHNNICRFVLEFNSDSL
jgi:hypothetical protein